MSFTLKELRNKGPLVIKKCAEYGPQVTFFLSGDFFFNFLALFKGSLCLLLRLVTEVARVDLKRAEDIVRTTWDRVGLALWYFARFTLKKKTTSQHVARIEPVVAYLEFRDLKFS